jgi:glycosyltransferase involved in cell wall biosynthesis
MKILQINKYYYLKGGSERYLFEVGDMLRKAGHTVMPFSMQDEANTHSRYEKYFAQKVDVNKFSLRDIVKFFYNYDAVKKLEILIKKERPDIAHLHNIYHQLSPAIIKVLKKNNIPVVMTLHDYKIICPNYKLYANNRYCTECQGGKYFNCLKNKCLKDSYLKSLMAMVEAYLNNKILKYYGLVDQFISPSYYLRDRCVEFGMTKKKIKVLPNFIDTEKFQPQDNIQKEDYLLYFGRLSAEKGIETAVKAMGLIADKKLRLKVVGSGPEYGRLKDIIETMQLGDCVTLTGPKYGDELKNIISAAKAIIIPSLWPENMPFSLLESLASGQIVIASRVGGMPEIIKDQENGFLFEAGNAGALAQKINDFNQIDLLKISLNARRSVMPLAKENHLKELLNIYSVLLRKKKDN